MGLIFECAFTDIFAIVLSIAICIIAYYKWCFTFWEKRNVPYLKPTIPWGTLNSIFFNRKSFGEVTLRQYLEAKQNGFKVVGLYGLTRPICLIIDPLIIKHVMATDFKNFMNRGVYYNERDDPLSAHLFAIEGIKWRNLRVKLTPTFTTGKMKTMFGILAECGNQLQEATNKLCASKQPIDIKELLARFTINIIGSAAFGIECNSFSDNNSEFLKYGRRIFKPSTIQLLKGLFGFANRDLGHRLGIRVTEKSVSDFFMKVVEDTVKYRETNNIERNDFLQLLIHLKNDVLVKGHEDEENVYNHDGKTLTIEELAAQAFVFFLAGFETSSTTMTFCLFELAITTDIQDKLRNEVVAVLSKHGGKISYESISEMKYMGQVIDETLRKYPPLPILSRTCNESYKIPDSDITLEENISVFIPAIGLHHDPEYFPNPEEFDPERFSEENKHSIRPYTYMPFGEGPRICIGLRFGIMQTKVGLAVLLKNYRFSLNTKTKIPLKMDPASFIQSTLGDIWLNVEKI